MVYWGCSTARNRCVWCVCAALSLTGAVLLCVGAAHMWSCNHMPGAAMHGQELASCRVRAGIELSMCPLLVVLGVLPSLLFFQSCFAVRPPPPVDWEKGIPASGITVVRRTSAGAAVYRYDAQGKLLCAPDCYRHTDHSTSHPGSLHASPAKGKGPQSYWAPGGLDACPAKASGGVADAAQGGKSLQHSRGGAVHGSSSSGGKAACCGSSSAGGSNNSSSRRPQGMFINGAIRAQLYGTDEEATAEVYISLSPRRPPDGPGSAPYAQGANQQLGQPGDKPDADADGRK